MRRMSDCEQLLSGYRDNIAEIERLECELKRWRSRAELVGVNIERVGGKSGKRERPEDVLVDLQDLLLSALVAAAATRKQIASVFGSVTDDRLKLLLQYRYVDCMTWEQVADKLNLDYRWTLRLHQRALDAIQAA